MNDNSLAKKTAESIISKYKLCNITLDDIVKVISDYGFDIIDFDPCDKTDNTFVLINELGLVEISKTAKAFTYQKDIVRLVFVRDNIPNEDKCYLLAHELGHIACDHLSSINASMQEEFEANEFAHYLLHPSLIRKLLYLARKRWAIVAVILLLVIGLVIGFSVNKRDANNKEYYKEFYITSGGEKYHRKNCYSIQGKNNIHRLTIEEYDSGKYEPCKLCQPE